MGISLTHSLSSSEGLVASSSRPRCGKMALTDNEVIVLIIFYIVLVLVALAVYIFIKYSVTIVHHAEVMVIERFGKYRTTLKPGLHFLVPFADRPRSVSWRYKTVRPG